MCVIGMKLSRMHVALSTFISLLDKLSFIIALLGGGILIIISCVVVVSVTGRWLFSQPIPGDYEFVRLGLAISVFAFLPYTQMRGGHVNVDTFTFWLPDGASRAIDSAWDILLSLIFALFAFGLWIGMLEMRLFGETLVEFGWPIWPVYGVCAFLCSFCAIAGLAGAASRAGVNK